MKAQICKHMMFVGKGANFCSLCDQGQPITQIDAMVTLLRQLALSDVPECNALARAAKMKARRLLEKCELL